MTVSHVDYPPRRVGAVHHHAGFVLAYVLEAAVVTKISGQGEERTYLALNVGYFRTWYGGFLVTENRAVPANGYDTFCVTAPTDSRLPGGGGNQICGLYDVKPEFFGRVENHVT